MTNSTNNDRNRNWKKALKLPPLPEITSNALNAISDRYGRGEQPMTLLPETGIFNAIYALGDDLIVRVPRDHPAFVAALENEAIVVPLARAAGVRTPALVDYDQSLTILSVPFTVYERVHGDTLGLLGLEPEQIPEAWRQLGIDLARLHHGVERSDRAEVLAERGPEAPDPRLRAAQLASLGHITTSEARWLIDWLDRLAPIALTPMPLYCTHGDIQSTNLMVSTGSLDYLALIDWGSAGWSDPAWDFAGIPLRAVPFMLTGYRADGVTAHDESLEARILWRHLQLALLVVPRPPDPIRSWAERPLTMLFDVLRFFLEEPGGRWHDLRP